MHGRGGFVDAVLDRHTKQSALRSKRRLQSTLHVLTSPRPHVPTSPRPHSSRLACNAFALYAHTRANYEAKDRSAPGTRPSLSIGRAGLQTYSKPYDSFHCTGDPGICRDLHASKGEHALTKVLGRAREDLACKATFFSALDRNYIYSSQKTL